MLLSLSATSRMTETQIFWADTRARAHAHTHNYVGVLLNRTAATPPIVATKSGIDTCIPKMVVMGTLVGISDDVIGDPSFGSGGLAGGGLVATRAVEALLDAALSWGAAA